MTIHIYAQSQWHDEAYIVGNHSALRTLRDAIDKALLSGNGMAEVQTFAEDGEGYDIHVMSVPEETLHKLAVPYTSEMAAEKNDAALRPWMILKAVRDKTVPPAGEKK